jgi:hypothetical protein
MIVSTTPKAMAANWPKRMGQAWPRMRRAIDTSLLTEAHWTSQPLGEPAEQRVEPARRDEPGHGEAHEGAAQVPFMADAAAMLPRDEHDRDEGVPEHEERPGARARRTA